MILHKSQPTENKNKTRTMKNEKKEKKPRSTHVYQKKRGKTNRKKRPWTETKWKREGKKSRERREGWKKKTKRHDRLKLMFWNKKFGGLKLDVKMSPEWRHLPGRGNPAAAAAASCCCWACCWAWACCPGCRCKWVCAWVCAWVWAWYSGEMPAICRRTIGSAARASRSSTSWPWWWAATGWPAPPPAGPPPAALGIPKPDSMRFLLNNHLFPSFLPSLSFTLLPKTSPSDMAHPTRPPIIIAHRPPVSTARPFSKHCPVLRLSFELQVSFAWVVFDWPGCFNENLFASVVHGHWFGESRTKVAWVCLAVASSWGVLDCQDSPTYRHLYLVFCFFFMRVLGSAYPS